MYIAILGRQPDISMAELEAVFGSDNVSWFSNDTATVRATSFDSNRLGGSPKAGTVVAEFRGATLRAISPKITKMYADKWRRATIKSH